jgi:glycosyltransferase involved in cell wall biosynthesis
MSTTPIVSVIMAAKNYGRFIAQAIDSVLNQTHADWELIIIDDGSSDHTAKVVEPHLMDRRIRYVVSDTLGQPRAKNLGYRLSRGQYLAYLDADDAWAPTKLARQLQRFEHNPSFGVVSCDRLLMDEQGTTRPAPATTPMTSGDLLTQVFLKNQICFSSVMIRREVFDHLGAFDPYLDVAIDYDLWLRLAAHYEFDNVAEPLVLYRTGHGNLSGKLADRVATAMNLMHRALFRRGLADRIPKPAIAEGHSTTCLALAYVLRGTEPWRAVRWYGRAFAWGGRRMESLRGMLVSTRNGLLGKRLAGVPENHSANA